MDPVCPRSDEEWSDSEDVYEEDDQRMGRVRDRYVRRESDGGYRDWIDDRKNPDLEVIKPETETETEEMMKMLAKDEAAGTFRVLRPEFAAKAIRFHRTQATGRVPDLGSAFMRHDAPSLVLRIHDENGPILADGYQQTIADEHGYYAQFTRAQLNKDAQLQRRARTKFCEKYGWTRFATPLGIDVYFSGPDPFVARRPDQPSTVVVTSSNVEDEEDGDCDRKRTASQAKITKFFTGSAPKRSKTEPTKKTGSRRSHSQFARGLFYVRVKDVVATSNRFSRT
jgi:hypothetical protein